MYQPSSGNECRAKVCQTTRTEQADAIQRPYDKADVATCEGQREQDVMSDAISQGRLMLQGPICGGTRRQYR